MLFGCGARFDLEAHGLPTDAETKTLLFKNRVFDGHGRPEFRDRLKKRPSRAGARYIAVFYQYGLPVLAHYIVISWWGDEWDRRERDFSKTADRAAKHEEKPVQDEPDMEDYGDIEEGTPDGDVPAYEKPETMRDVWEQQEEEDEDDDGFWSELMGDVIGAILGVFIGGLVFIATKEEVVRSSEKYAYDERGRLTEIRICAPKDDVLLEHTLVKFHYSGDAKDPYDMEIVPQFQTSFSHDEET